MIQRVEVTGPDRRARRLVLSDFDESRTTSAQVIRQLGLDEGVELDEQELSECELSLARERALRVLGHRDRSTQELRRRLSDDGYPAETVAQVVERLEELGLLDDDRFAHQWARTRRAQGVGPARAVSELVSKGIDKDFARLSVAEEYADEDIHELARRLLGTKPIASRKDRDRAIRMLVRKGFDISSARAVVDSQPDSTS